MKIESDKVAIDRTGWPAGPWDNEPEDRVDFTHCGFACLLHRNHMGGWCGYVGLPLGHPDYSVPYDDVDADVHGGLTYSRWASEYIGLGKDDNLWWVGFDTSHHRDLTPGMLALEMRHGWEYSIGNTYWTRDRAMVETMRLADQMRKG